MHACDALCCGAAAQPSQAVLELGRKAAAGACGAVGLRAALVQGAHMHACSLEWRLPALCAAAAGQARCSGRLLFQRLRSDALS